MDVREACDNLRKSGLYDDVLCYGMNDVRADVSFTCTWGQLLVVISQLVAAVMQRSNVSHKDAIKIISLLSESTLKTCNGEPYSEEEVNKIIAKIRKISRDFEFEAIKKHYAKRIMED